MTAHVVQSASSTDANSADEASPSTRQSRWRLEVTAAAGSAVAVAGRTVAVSPANLAGKGGYLNPGSPRRSGTHLSRPDHLWRDRQSPSSERWRLRVVSLAASVAGSSRRPGAEVPPRGAST